MQLLVASWDPGGTEPCAQAIGRVDGRITVRVVPMAGLLQLLASDPPNVLLLEHRAEPDQGSSVLSSIAMLSPGTRVLLMSDDCTSAMVVDFVRHGASGWLPRSSDAATIAKAVRSVHDGQKWFGRTQLFQAVRVQLEHAHPVARTPSAQPLDGDDTPASLTEREREILGLIGQALSNKEIARRLHISAATVKTHLHRIYVKLNQSGRYKAFVAQTPQLRSGTPR